jgi:hypothetical protein
VNVVTFQGTLLAGPAKSTCERFPSGLVNAKFELTPSNKAAAVSCYQVRSLNSSVSFVELAGVGTAETVTQATFLYLRTSAKISIRVTQVRDAGDEVNIHDVQGLLVLEVPVGNYVKLLEAQGVGTVEYFASGSQ